MRSYMQSTSIQIFLVGWMHCVAECFTSTEVLQPTCLAIKSIDWFRTNLPRFSLMLRMYIPLQEMKLLKKSILRRIVKDMIQINHVSASQRNHSIHQSGLLGFVTALRTNSVLLFLGNSVVHFVFYYLYRSLYVPVYGPISGLKIHTGRCNNAALKTIH
jgi:hypothetical protein